MSVRAYSWLGEWLARPGQGRPSRIVFHRCRGEGNSHPDGAARVNTRVVSDESSNLILPELPSADRRPAELYLAGRPPGSRAGARAVLDTMAALLTAGGGTAQTLAWHLLRSEHVGALRAALAERCSAAAARTALAALRGVLKRCWQLGLMSTEDYHRASAAAAAGGTQSSRGELRSVFESCAEDAPPAVTQGGAVRMLLYGNGAKQGKAIMEAAGSQLPTPSVRGTAMSMEQLHLRRAAPREAIAHALWEAGVCLRSSAFCASLAMLRKALDLWSADYRRRHGLDGERGGDDPRDLAARLTAIAQENRLYADTIHTILESLRHDAQGLDAGMVCRGGYASSFDGYAVTRIKETYRNLHELVVTLITATTPELPL